MNTPAWRKDAACLNAVDDRGRVFLAWHWTAQKKLCEECPVLESCFNDAIDEETGAKADEVYFIRGGVSERARVEILGDWGLLHVPEEIPEGQCSHGHDLTDPDNVRTNDAGKWHCVPCRRKTNREGEARRYARRQSKGLGI